MCKFFFFFFELARLRSFFFFFFRVCQTPDFSNSLFRVIILTTPWLRAAIPYAASSALLTSTNMLVLATCVLPFQATPQCFPQVLIRICPVLGTLLLPCSFGLRPLLSRPPSVRNRSIVLYPVRRVIRAPDLSLLPLSSIPLPPVLLGCR
jgi:hypothetical protein